MYVVVKDTHTGSYVSLSSDSPAFKNQSALSRYQPVAGSGSYPTLDAALHEVERVSRYQLPFLELVNTVLHRAGSLNEVESLLSDLAVSDPVAEVDRDLTGAVDDAFAERDTPEVVRSHRIDNIEFRSYIQERLNIPFEAERDPVAHALWERRQRSVFLPSQAVENVDRFIRSSESPEQQQVRKLWANNEQLLGDAGHAHAPNQTPEIAPHVSALDQEAVRTNENLIVAADQRLDKDLGHPNRWRSVVSEQAVALDRLASASGASLTVRVSTANKADLALGMAALEAQSLGAPVTLDLLNVHANDLAAFGAKGAAYDHIRDLLLANANSSHKMQAAGDAELLNSRLNKKRRDAKRILTHQDAKGDLGFKPKRSAELISWGSASDALARGKQFPFQAGQNNGDMLLDSRGRTSSKKPLPPVSEHQRLGGLPEPVEPPTVAPANKEAKRLVDELNQSFPSTGKLPDLVQPAFLGLPSLKPPAHGLTEGLRGAVHDQQLPVDLESSNKHVADLLAGPTTPPSPITPKVQPTPLGGVSHPVGQEALPGVQPSRTSDAERRALASDLASSADDLTGPAPKPARIGSLVGNTFRLSAPLPRRTEPVSSGSAPRGAISSSSVICPRCMGNPAAFARYAKGSNDGKCFQCGGSGRIEQVRPTKGRNFTLTDTPGRSPGLPGDPEQELQQARDLLKRSEQADDFHDPASSLRALLEDINKTPEGALKGHLQKTRETASGYDWSRAIHQDAENGSFDRRMRARAGYRQAEHAEAAGLKHNVLKKLPEDIQDAYNQHIEEQVRRGELTHTSPQPEVFDPTRGGTGRAGYRFRTSHDFEALIQNGGKQIAAAGGSLPALAAIQSPELRAAGLCPVCAGTGIERRYDDFKAASGLVGRGRPMVCGSCSGSGAKRGLSKKGFQENIGRAVVEGDDTRIRVGRTPREVIDDLNPGQLPNGARRTLMGGVVSVNAARQLGTLNRLASTGLNYLPGSGAATTKLGALALGFAAQGLLTSAWNPTMSAEQRAQLSAEHVVSRVGSMGLGTPHTASRVAAEDRAEEYANVASGVVGLGVGAVVGGVVRNGLQRPITGRRASFAQSLLNGVTDTHGVHAGRAAGTLATIAAAVAVAALSQPAIEGHVLEGLLANERRQRRGRDSNAVDLNQDGRYGASLSSVDAASAEERDLVVDISFQDEYGQELEVGSMNTPSYDIQIDDDSSEDFEEAQ